MNTANPPKNHHVIPRFYLRNFAKDEEKRKVSAVTKNGSYADWRVTSIGSTATEENFYKVPYLGNDGIYETEINIHVETPISQSAGWQKVVDGRLDFSESDVFDLYCLLKHFLARTPHAKSILSELVLDSTRSNSHNSFGFEERQRFQALANSRLAAELHFAKTATDIDRFFEPFKTATIAFFVSELPLLTSSAPTTPIKIDSNSDVYLPEPGMIPLLQCLALSPKLLMVVTQTISPMRFVVGQAPPEVTHAFNSQVAGQFMFFENIRQLIAPRALAHEVMNWGPYSITKTTERQTKFKRDPNAVLHKPIS